MSDTYTVAYVAEQMGIRKETVRSLLKRKDVPFGLAVRGEGGRWTYVIPKRAFDRWMCGEVAS